MLQNGRFCFVTVSFAGFVLFAPCPPLTAQTTPPADTKLALRAALVLTPDFCATTFGKNHSMLTVEESFAIGEAACPQLETTLKGVFSSLTRVEAATLGGDAQILLLPRFVDVKANRPTRAHAEREMIAVLEWTVKDAGGKTVWLDTVQSTVQHEMGRSRSDAKKGADQLIQDSVKSLAEQSATKISSSPELRKLVH